MASEAAADVSSGAGVDEEVLELEPSWGYAAAAAAGGVEHDELVAPGEAEDYGSDVLSSVEEEAAAAAAAEEVLEAEAEAEAAGGVLVGAPGEGQPVPRQPRTGGSGTLPAPVAPSCESRAVSASEPLSAATAHPSCTQNRFANWGVAAAAVVAGADGGVAAAEDAAEVEAVAEVEEVQGGAGLGGAQEPG